MEIVVATRSAHKLREIQEILSPTGEFQLLDLDAAGVPEAPEEERIEVHDTFAANARAKARYFAAKTGRLVLADDSGICVDALGGAPGVRSKRFSGRADLSGQALDRANNALLLESLRSVPAESRTAHYVCAVAIEGPGIDETCVGRCDGVVLAAPRGSEGFGYDPLFFLPEEDATFGELSPERKNQISHRARAVRQAAGLLRRWRGGEEGHSSR